MGWCASVPLAFIVVMLIHTPLRDTPEMGGDGWNTPSLGFRSVKTERNNFLLIR